MAEFTHIGPDGAGRMVDVGEKPVTDRRARARGLVRMQSATAKAIQEGRVKKGNVLEVARLAGIQGAKRTADLIPLCHTLSLDGVDVEFEWRGDGALQICAEVRTHARTGVEMEALSAVAIAALTVYDMCKSADRAMEIGPIVLDHKSGGASGTFER